MSQQRDINAMAFFSRAVLMHAEISSVPKDHGFTDEQLDRWHASEWKDEYADQIQAYLQPYEGLLAELDRASPCMDVDYPLLVSELNLHDSVYLLLPEIQRARDLARLLKLRGRMEMHSGRWTQLEKTARTMYRLADMVGRSNKVLVTRLVSFAICKATNDMIQQASALKDAPSFYWALAVVPPSLFEVRDSIDHEIFSRTLNSPDIGPLPETMIGTDRSRALLKEVFDNAAVILQAAQKTDPTLGQLAGGLAVVALAQPAKEYLRDTTPWGEQAEKLSNAEAVLRATQLEMDRITSDTGKWFWLPENIRQEHLERSEEMLRKAMQAPSDFVSPAAMLFGWLVPSVQAASASSLRTRQDHHQLVTIQALRDFAARKDRLPRSLDELILPAWPDPLANDGFDYSLTSPTTAILTHAPSFSKDQTTIRIELKR